MCAGGQTVLRPVEHNLGLGLGRRGRGYRISPLATHSLSSARYFLPPRPGLLRPPFDLAHDSHRRRRNSAGISSSLDVGCVEQQNEGRKNIDEKEAERQRETSIGEKIPGEDGKAPIVTDFSYLFPLDGRKDSKIHSFLRTAFPTSSVSTAFVLVLCFFTGPVFSYKLHG